MGLSQMLVEPVSEGSDILLRFPIIRPAMALAVAHDDLDRSAANFFGPGCEALRLLQGYNYICVAVDNQNGRKF